jgi:hypothetical protein
MFIILHPEDLRSEYRGDKKKPNIESFHFSPHYMEMADVILYRYDDQTLVLKGPTDI